MPSSRRIRLCIRIFILRVSTATCIFLLDGGKRSDSRQHFADSGEKHLLKQSLITIQTQHLHGLFEFWRYLAISNSTQAMLLAEPSVTVDFAAVATVTVGFSCVSLRGTVNHWMLDDETNATILSGEIRLKRSTRLQGRAVTLLGTGI